MSAEPLFATTVGVRDPEAVPRALGALGGTVVLGLAAVALPITFMLLPMSPWWTPPRSSQPDWVGVAVDGPDGDDWVLLVAAAGEPLEAPAPREPEVVQEAAPEPTVDDREEDPELPAEPESTPEDPTSDPEAETDDEPDQDEGDGEPDSEADAVTGEQVEGTEDGQGDAATDARPMQAIGLSSELAPGEMATCLVRPTGPKWSVQGCAEGLHHDAIQLARLKTTGGRVMVILKGA